MPDKLEPKAEKCVFIGYPKETIGYTFYHRSEGKVFVAKNESFLEKEFLSKEVSGRKVELDEVIEPSLELESSAALKVVPAPPAPTREEANDEDHETSNNATTELCRSTRSRATPEWYGNPILTVMLLDNNEPANYEEAMMSPNSGKLLEAMKSELGSMSENQVWLWWTLLATVRTLSANGSSRRKRMRIVMLPSTRLGLSQKVFGKFKVLTTMRLSLP
jgi:hypothetical protein